MPCPRTQQANLLVFPTSTARSTDKVIYRQICRQLAISAQEYRAVIVRTPDGRISRQEP